MQKMRNEVFPYICDDIDIQQICAQRKCVCVFITLELIIKCISWKIFQTYSDPVFVGEMKA